MGLIDEGTRQQLRERLAASLEGTVELCLYRRPGSGRLVLPSGLGCPTCDAAEELARTLTEIAPDRLRLTVVDVSRQPAEVEVVPSLTVGVPGDESRIVFQGLPAGYEFATLLDAVERTSRGEHGLSPDTLTWLEGLRSEVELMVFVTPDCRYCPQAASMANRMALASSRVRSLVVEANEFPDLADRYRVQGVPRTVVNRTGAFVGALPEASFVASVRSLATGEAA
jgi:glutaredoxin-like protein